MKTLKNVLNISLFVFATAAAFAFSPVYLADQFTTTGFRTTTACNQFTTVESDCDLEETSGNACHVIVTGQSQIAQKSGCSLTLFRDDE